MTLSISLQKVDELAEIAVTAHNKQDEHDKAVEAALLIRSVPRRMAKLQMHGYWKPLADLTQAPLQPLLHLAKRLDHSRGCRTECRLVAHRVMMATQHLFLVYTKANAAMSACCWHACAGGCVGNLLTK